MAERIFRRKLYEKMLQWKQERDGKTALLIKFPLSVANCATSTCAERLFHLPHQPHRLTVATMAGKI